MPCEVYDLTYIDGKEAEESYCPAAAYAGGADDAAGSPAAAAGAAEEQSIIEEFLASCWQSGDGAVVHSAAQGPRIATPIVQFLGGTVGNLLNQAAGADAENYEALPTTAGPELMRFEQFACEVAAGISGAFCGGRRFPGETVQRRAFQTAF